MILSLVNYIQSRLTAPYLYVLGVVEVVMRYLEQNSVFEPPTQDHINCPKYWWRNILYVNTLFPVEQMVSSKIAFKPRPNRLTVVSSRTNNFTTSISVLAIKYCQRSFFFSFFIIYDKGPNDSQGISVFFSLYIIFQAEFRILGGIPDSRRNPRLHVASKTTDGIPYSKWNPRLRTPSPTSDPRLKCNPRDISTFQMKFQREFQSPYGMPDSRRNPR